MPTDFDNLFSQASGRYKSNRYDGYANELYSMYMSFIRAGFNADCSMELLLTIINAILGGN